MTRDPRRHDGVTRPAPLTIVCDGAPLSAYPGETVAAALLAASMRRLRDDRSDRPRGMFCNMGTCSECFVWLREGSAAQWHRRRACLTPVSADLELSTREDTCNAD